MHSRTLIKSPRYGDIAKIAREFIIEQDIRSLPVDPFLIARQNNWKIEKASEVARDMNISINHLMQDILNTKDGIAIYCPKTDEYCILYNDKIKTPGRIRWTMMHEIGHIVLNHLDNENTAIAKGTLSEEEYVVFEKEADFFASLVLAPPIVLHNLNIQSPKEIKNICQLSAEASFYRYDYYTRWKTFAPVEEDQSVLKNFQDFIYSIKRKEGLYGSYSESK